MRECVMWRGQSVGTDVSDSLDNTSVEPRFAITGTHLTQIRTAQTKTSSIFDNTNNILI